MVIVFFNSFVEACVINYRNWHPPTFFKFHLFNLFTLCMSARTCVCVCVFMCVSTNPSLHVDVREQLVGNSFLPPCGS